MLPQLDISINVIIHVSKVVQIKVALVPVPSPDKWGGLQQERHPA